MQLQSTIRTMLLLALGGVASCQHAPTPPSEVAIPAPPVLYEWKGEGLTGPVAVTIDLSEQKARLTRGGHPAGWTYVASGISRYPTPAGSFRISEKVRDKHSNLWGTIVNAEGTTVNHDARNGRDPVPAGGRFVGAPMPYWMRINGAIGMHAGPIPYPGSPASHGCIRLPGELAEILFEKSVIGTPVRVVP